MELRTTGPWCEDGGPHADVVMSCRVRFARNITGFPFVNCASDEQLEKLVNLGRRILLNSKLADGMFWVDLDGATEHDRELLVERHIISRQLADGETPSGVAISGDETLSVMVNEEDHLRMQILGPGLQLDELFERLNRVDDAIEGKVDYAFSPRWGYQTACPTNVGTGIRFSVMMHLPALKITNQIDRIRRAARDLHLAVRGFYGEGSDSAGDFYQISNQVTLGRDERELLEEFQGLILPKMIEYEQAARDALVRRNATLLDDRIHRALGVLRSARLLGLEEAMKLLSRIRLGARLARLPDIPTSRINELFLLIQPAHLRQHVCGRELPNDALRVARASVVRQRLG